MKILGNILKEGREKKNLNLNELSKKLNISQRYLEAIESGDYKKFPGEPYTLSFVKSYAKYLNLDLNLVVSIYKDEFVNINKTSSITLPINKINEKFVYFKFFTGTFILLTFVIIFYKFFLYPAYFDVEYAMTPELDADILAILEGEQLKNDINKLKQEQKTVTLIKKDTNNIEKLENIEKYTKNNNSSAVASVNTEIVNKNVLLKFLGDTWIQIKDENNKIIIVKLMRKNETFIFESDKKYIITTGNAGNIQLMINNEAIGKLGKKGEILNSFNLESYLENIKLN